MTIPQWQWKAVLFVSVFLSCVSFSVVMPSLWPYLRVLGANQQFLAWVVAAYSIGEAIGAVLFGWLSGGRQTRDIMLLATVVGLVGSVFYIAAESFPGSVMGPALVLAGRSLQGMWTGGSQAVQQSHLAKTLPHDELTSSTVVLNSFACLGFIFGPAIALVAAVIPPFTVPGLPFLRFSECTAAGYVVLISSLVIIFLFAFSFEGTDQEHHHLTYHDDFLVHNTHLSEQAAPLLASPDHDGMIGEQHLCVRRTDGDYGSGGRKREANATSSLCTSRPSSVVLALVACNIAFFTHFYGFAIQETITTPLVQNYYNWTVFQANLLFTAAGVAALGAFGALALLSSVMEDRLLATWSLGIGALGFAMLVSTPDYSLGYSRFLAGFLVISIAFPLGRATVIALYTKILPQAWQGSGQGVILAVGAVARILGPFWAVRAFDDVLGDLIVFGATAALFLVTLFIFVVTYGSLGEPLRRLPSSLKV
jgi:MFS transporter, ceroid-lipofuscinosis neuronal protein 7